MFCRSLKLHIETLLFNCVNSKFLKFIAIQYFITFYDLPKTSAVLEYKFLLIYLLKQSQTFVLLK